MGSEKVDSIWVMIKMLSKLDLDMSEWFSYHWNLGEFASSKFWSFVRKIDVCD